MSEKPDTPEPEVEITRRDVADLEKVERWRYDQLVALSFDREQAFTLALLRHEADLTKIRRWRKAGASPNIIFGLLVG